MSARKFSMVSPAIWRPGRFLSLGDPKAQVLYLYFLTCEHQNSAGCFRLPDGYASADLDWPTEQYVSVRQTLIEGDMIAFDAATSTIYVERWFQHCAAMSDKHAIGTPRSRSDKLTPRTRASSTSRRFSSVATRTRITSFIGSEKRMFPIETQTRRA